MDSNERSPRNEGSSKGRTKGTLLSQLSPVQTRTIYQLDQNQDKQKATKETEIFAKTGR
jgi:hypothetical protein